MRTKLYTAATVDWLAVWDATVDCCFYVPAAKLGDGMASISLRLLPTLNRQVRGTHSAERYTSI